jgi:hypothetical protein
VLHISLSQFQCHTSSYVVLLELVQEVASSPMLIDAVQALLQNSAAYASLVEHPEMAPYIRGLRRLVGAPRHRRLPCVRLVCGACNQG